jgi:hypothetical protein
VYTSTRGRLDFSFVLLRADGRVEGNDDFIECWMKGKERKQQDNRSDDDLMVVVMMMNPAGLITLCVCVYCVLLTLPRQLQST